MDFKIKIDLSNQSIIDDNPNKPNKKTKEKANPSQKISKSKSKSDNPINNLDKTPQLPKSKKKKHSKATTLEEDLTNKPKVNSSSIISLSLPTNENIKGDQSQKLNMINKKKPRHWDQRWVLVPNVFEFTKEIWLKKWVLVDGGDDIVDNNVL